MVVILNRETIVVVVVVVVNVAALACLACTSIYPSSINLFPPPLRYEYLGGVCSSSSCSSNLGWER